MCDVSTWMSFGYDILSFSTVHIEILLDNNYYNCLIMDIRNIGLQKLIPAKCFGSNFFRLIIFFCSKYILPFFGNFLQIFQKLVCIWEFLIFNSALKNLTNFSYFIFIFKIKIFTITVIYRIILLRKSSKINIYI